MTASIEASIRFLVSLSNFSRVGFGGSYGGGGLPWRRPGFSGLAKQVLAADASRSFRLETAILGFVTLVTAWPIAVMLREVIRLLK